MFDFMDAMGNDFGVTADSFTAGGGMPGSANPMEDIQQALMMEQMNQTPVNNMQGTVQGMPGKVSSTSVDEIQQMLPTAPYQRIGGGEGASAKGSGIMDGGDILSKNLNGMMEMFGGGGGGGGAGMASLFAAFSDRRLKRNIQPIGIYKGNQWYSYDYIWGESSIGVMADEVPHAAFMHPSGFMMVDYSKVI